MTQDQTYDSVSRTKALNQTSLFLCQVHGVYARFRAKSRHKNDFFDLYKAPLVAQVWRFDGARMR